MIADDAYGEILIEHDGPVATLTLNRPESLNALTPLMLEQAGEAVRAVAASDARVLIVRGAGRAFCVGADLKLTRAPGWGVEHTARFANGARALQALFETMPQAVIAKVHGHCLTGGLEIAIAADLIVATEDAQFADTHAKVGYRPRWGMSQRLPRLIGKMRSTELAFTARTLDGREAAAIGLILEAVPADQLDQRVADLAAVIAANNPGSIAAYKALVHQAQHLGLGDGLAFEAEAEFPFEASRRPAD